MQSVILWVIATIAVALGSTSEIAGFVWWQGHKNTGSSAHDRKFEENLVRLIKSLWKVFDTPNAVFLLATMAFNGWKLEGNGLTIANV